MAERIDRPDYAGFARVRIVGWVLLLMTLGLAAAGSAIVVVEADRIDRRADANIEQEFDEEGERLADGIDPETSLPFESADDLLRSVLERNVPKRHEVYMAVLDGRVRFVSNGPETNLKIDLSRDPEFVAAVSGVEDVTFGAIDTEDGEVRYGVLPVEQGGEVQAAYVIAYFTDPWRGQFVEVMGSYAVVALLTLLLVAGGAWLIAGRLLRPVHELEAAAREINDTDLTQRLEAEGRGELSGLAETFNEMLDRLASAFDTQRQFLDDAGHELATPITILQGHLELLDHQDADEVDETRSMLLDELDRMNRMVRDLVLLAKSERPDFVVPQDVDLAAFTRDALRLCSALDDRPWVVDAVGEGSVRGDPQRLTQAVLQLAANAVRYSGAGTTVALGSRVTPEGFELWVRDEGPGVPPEEVEGIFDRFARGSAGDRAEGSGLGLAIVRSIADGHHGTVRLVTPPEGGALFLLELPAAAAPRRRHGHGTSVGPAEPSVSRPATVME